MSENECIYIYICYYSIFICNLLTLCDFVLFLTGHSHPIVASRTGPRLPEASASVSARCKLALPSFQNLRPLKCIAPGFWISYGSFPRMGAPKNGWFMMEHPVKMDDDWGYPDDYGNLHIGVYVYTVYLG